MPMARADEGVGNLVKDRLVYVLTRVDRDQVTRERNGITPVVTHSETALGIIEGGDPTVQSIGLHLGAEQV